MILSLPQLIDGCLTNLIVCISEGDSLTGSVQIRTDAKFKEVAKLHSLFVEKECRLEGIGSMLMERAEKIARAAGCRSIGLHVELANLEIRPFYEQLGYTAVYQFDDGDVQFVKQLQPLDL